MEEQKKKSNAAGFAILLIIAIIVIVTATYLLLSGALEKKEEEPESHSAKIETKVKKEEAETLEVVSENEYAVKDNAFSKFDLSFLQFENKEENKIYSPLSIKYAFKMLEEATTGKAHDQIGSIIEAYNLTEYESNEHMALANAFFIRDSYKDEIKENYINALKTKYNADIEFDDFSNAKKINTWVNNHTLNLLPELLQDSDVTSLDFALVNALGIDMDWNHKFLEYYDQDDEKITSAEEYAHEKIQGEQWGFQWYADQDLVKKSFNEGKQKVSAMEVLASFNNYDVIGEFGEDKIYEIVYADFKDWALGTGKYKNTYNGHDDYAFEGDFSEENIKNVFDKWYYNKEYPSETGKYSYINRIKANYGKEAYSTDFSLYVDDEVKVFAKDLKEYDGTTLQYIGIMPKTEDLASYVEGLTHDEVQGLIGNLKELKKENFKDGYITYIHGYIPKFNFEYELDIQEDLQKMGITDVFIEGKANLDKMTENESAYIGEVKHKANIEFTQDGIKAAAATMAGGLGAGEWYDYFFEVPTEEIDITFDKPYLFLIRDKKTSETWFVGTVYEPLNADEDTTSQYMMEVD